MLESQIIEKIKKGDIKTFEKVFREYYEALCNYASTFIKDYDLAEELVQDIFYLIWKKHSEIEITSTIKGYLFQAVKNHCMQHIRHKKVENKYAEKVIQELGHPVYVTSDELIVNELTEKIDKTLQSMPEKTREVFTMSRFEGLKYHEIAEKLSISIKTVEAAMGKALKMFRENLGQWTAEKKH